MKNKLGKIIAWALFVLGFGCLISDKIDGNYNTTFWLIKVVGFAALVFWYQILKANGVNFEK